MALAKKKIKTKAKAKPATRKPVSAAEYPDSAVAFEKLLKKTDGLQHYSLRLFITGTTARSTEAVANVRALCEEHLPGRYDLEVVDIYQQPTKATGEQIIAAPTLLKKLPAPAKRIIGNLSDRARVILGLNLKVTDGKTAPTKWTKL